jgi:hypothetical protein
LSDKSKYRETSNKALGAVNNLALVPFLMAFLSSRDRLPLPTVTSAGASQFRFAPPGAAIYGYKAQCLYVLTDDNPPAADQVRVNFSYVSRLLEIANVRGGVDDVKGKGPAAEERAVTLGILACGAFGWRGVLNGSLKIAQVFCGTSHQSHRRRPLRRSTSIKKSFFLCLYR